jgi:site-specific DNA recombinase
MKPPTKHCAIYTRKSSDEGLEQEFNSLDAQREACLAYIQSQKSEGWTPVKQSYNDGGFSDYGASGIAADAGRYQSRKGQYYRGL